ncbi:MAG TPA: ATP-binding protein [Candidatus Saccharibacteria bacterium]|nr:ATP-binding protein [Candidatus Saccharibacteria bacterium]
MSWWEIVILLSSSALAFFAAWLLAGMYHLAHRERRAHMRLKRVFGSSALLRPRMQHLLHELTQIIPAKSAVLFVYQDENRYASVGTHHASHPSLRDCLELDEYVAAYPEQVVLERTKFDSHHPVRQILSSYRVDFVIVLMRATKPIGYVFLHETPSVKVSRQDLQLARLLAGDMAMAMENAVLMQTKHDLSVYLQQKIDSATNELRTSNVQLVQLDEAKDEFLSMASHQLRTPLTSVKGYLSMVLEGDAGKISAVQRKLLTEAFTSSERMVRLISDFLNVSRIQTGKFVIERTEVDIVKLINQEIDALESTAKARELTFRRKIPKQSLVLALDEDKIRQVIMNFIDNAVFYSRPNTEIAVELTLRPHDVTFRVVDTGIGVPVAQQPQLFTKFFRASNARKQRPDGTGIGLFLAKKIVDGHKGHVVFSSTEGEGSVFGFRLPK